MRLGEIKNILWEVLSEEDKIIIDNESIFGGQAQIVKNYGPLISALDILAGQGWNSLDYTEIEGLKKDFGNNLASVQLPQDRFNQLNSYVTSLNSKLPLYASILEEMVDDQDKHTINIKLSESIKDLEQLTAANKRLNNILKLYNVDGQFEFEGFDKGTDWYVITAAGALSYRFLIAGIDIAQKYFDTRKSYFESEKARLDYMAAIDKEVVTETDLQNYQERRMRVLVEDEVEKAIQRIGAGSNNNNELGVKLIMATQALIKELDEAGTEFHLSLNPPVYANESMGSIVIDYSKMPVLAVKKEEKAKQIEAVKVEEKKKEE